MATPPIFLHFKFCSRTAKLLLIKNYKTLLSVSVIGTSFLPPNAVLPANRFFLAQLSLEKAATKLEHRIYF